ncbi:MAG: 4Fe-4S dicluster domain-containing protein [Eubacteriales bacterium]|nr:4Fe-4S dicluster domain-containing protein [Eubacteriales bacterium]
MDLLEKVREAGVIGAGGAGFPTHVKLQAQAEYILINGAECEPLLRVDQQLMAVHPAEVIQGLVIGKQITGAKHAIIGIKGHHKDVIEILRKTIKDLKLEDEVEVGILPDVYPAGDEMVLVKELTGRVVPEGGIPIAVGCVVMNSESAYNVYRASQDLSVTDKYITVTGDVPNPITVKVPIGTPIMDVLKLSGREDFTGYTVINGGPMMGPLFDDLNGYVTKKTKGLIVLPSDHPHIIKKQRTIQTAFRLNRGACEQCTDCTMMCPRHLLGHSTVPHKMVRAMMYNAPADEKVKAALACSQCGLCEFYTCPAGIAPKLANFYYMGKLREQGIRLDKKDEFIPNPMRPYRMVPVTRLIARIGLTKYDVPAPLTEEKVVDPEVVGIGLKDHVGAPAVPTVAVGDKVEVGDKIADIKEGALGATVHASIAGTVESVDPMMITIRRD